MVCIDVTHGVIAEAMARGCNMVVSHHPLIFGGLKRITPGNAAGGIIIKAIRDNISIYATHTNLDNIAQGVSFILASKLGILEPAVLKPRTETLRKLVTFSPLSHAGAVRDAIFGAGAGHIGNYDGCSFNSEGYGTFRALKGATPYVGEVGETHREEEVRIEAIFPSWLQKDVVAALLASHPYEEVAYDIYQLMNSNVQVGTGMIGMLPEALDAEAFLDHVKKTLHADHLRYAAGSKHKIQRVAVCGGSGAFLISDAMAAGADAYVTGDIKYHDFFRPEGRMLLVDAGHYETEQFAAELLQALLMKNFPNFAVLISEQATNPVRYL
jgi:dinuclear metal center YbgI/SA1388 family protein